MNKVSVLMSVYNENLSWIDQAVESILKQENVDIQLIIVVDKPHDFDLVQHMERLNDVFENMVLLINDVNRGLVYCLNRALSVADGEFIARMDADDIANYNRFSLQIKYLKEYKLDFVMAETELITENEEHIEKKYLSEIHGEYFNEIERAKNISRHSTWLAKKFVFEKLNGYRQIQFTEDLDFVYRAMEQGFAIGKMGIPVVRYRVRFNGISKKNALSQWLIYTKLRKLAKKGLVSTTSEDEINDVINQLKKSQIESFNRSNEQLVNASKTNKIYIKLYIYLAAICQSRQMLDLFKFSLTSKFKLKNIYRKYGA